MNNRMFLGAMCAALLAGCADSGPPFLGEWQGKDRLDREVSVTFAADTVSWSVGGDTETVEHVIYLHSLDPDTNAYVYATPDNDRDGRVLRIDESGTMTVYRGGKERIEATLQYVE